MKTIFSIQKSVRNSRSISALQALKKLQGLGLLVATLLIGSLQVQGACTTIATRTFSTSDWNIDHTTYTDTWTDLNCDFYGAGNNSKAFDFARLAVKGCTTKSCTATTTATCYIRYNNAITSSISKVIINHAGTTDAIGTNLSVNWVALSVYNGSTKVDSVVITAPSLSKNESGTFEFTPTSGDSWASGYKYYFYANITSKGNSNRGINISSLQFDNCESCANSVTINKGTSTNCTFTLSKSGAQASCSGVSTTVSVSPNTGYGSPIVTESGASATPTITGSGNSWTVTYAANTTGTSTINVSCSALTTTVSFNQNGGEGGQIATKTATYGQAMPTPITLPTLYGHTFGGYYDGAGGTGTQYYTNTGASARSWDKTSATATLYAKWTENALTNYRTTCESCATASSVTASPVTGTTATINWSGAVSSTGYTIVWSTGSSFPGSLDASNSQDVASGTSSYQITGLEEDTKYYVWVVSKCDDSRSESINFTTPVEHTITFNYPTGFTLSGTTPLAVEDGETFTFPNVTKPGSGYDCVHSFKGWVLGANYTGQTTFYTNGTTSDEVTADATYTAVFIQNDGSSSAGANDYELVTDEADLESGGKYIMVGYKSTSPQGYYALGKQNTNNRPGVAVTVVDGVISDPSASLATAAGQDSKIYELTLGGSEGAWTFKDVSNSYLLASSGSNNYLKSQASLDAKGKTEWSIEIAKDGHATIDTKYYSYDEDGADDWRGSIYYNLSSTLFSCYVRESDMPRIYLFKKGGTSRYILTATPNCSLRMSGEIAVTSYNGRGIMAATPLAVLANGLTPSTGTVTLSSNSSDIYFSANRLPNFAKDSKPTSTVVLTANGSGVIDTDVYVHYKPSSTGNGSASEVIVTATPSGGLTDAVEHLIHVRNMPEKFVVAAKLGNTWYALPADLGDTEGTPEAIVIDVDENTMTATASKVAPKTCTYTLWPVRTTDNTSTDRYSSDGGNAGECIRLAAISVDNEALWANNSASGGTTKIKTANTTTTLGGGGDAANEWRITTTINDGKWTYNLQSNQSNQIDKSRYLYLYKEDVVKWGTYNNGISNNLYFLPVVETEPFDVKAVEWYPTKVLIQTSNAVSSPSVTIGGVSVASPTCTSKGSKLYEIGGLDLTNVSNAGKTMRISYVADAKTYSACVRVPIILSRSSVNVSSAPFTTLTPAVYNTADLVVRDGAVLTLNGTKVQNTFFDVTIYPTSKISVPAEKKIGVHSLAFLGGIDEIYDGSEYAVNKYGVPELSLKGKCGQKTNPTIDYIMRVDLSQMYALALPYDVALSDITYWDGTAMTPGADLYISAYDGQARANREEKAWVYEKDFDPDSLKAGVGYTISAELQSGVGATYSIIRLPMKKNFAKDNSEAAKTVPVKAYVNTKGETVTDNHKGWNFVGNPYMASISGGEPDSKLIVGKLVPNNAVEPWDGSYMWDGTTYPYRYVTIPSDDGTENWQSKWTEVTLKPFKNFFIQVGTSGDLSFALASRADAPARYMQAQEHEVEFEVLLSSEMSHDHTGLLLADKYTPAYEINADLEKMENPMSVYTLTGGYKLAYNALSPNDAKQPIPVGYIANEAGTYTFQLDERSDVNEVEHIWLTDYELDRVTDLMEAAYDFTTIVGRNETRFALTVELRSGEEIATDIGNSIDGIVNDGAVKFIWHDKIYILNQGVIYDATGKRVREIDK